MKATYLCNSKEELLFVLQNRLPLDKAQALELGDLASRHPRVEFSVLVQAQLAARLLGEPRLSQWVIVCQGGVKHRTYELVDVTSG